ncbi:putative serine protease K12H4.7 [Lycorma delicatula]|uniref:putative serine protease K12H4.7 n=1 Tax=Lycorma delicatula TaxID=130591 RepID=UPI003F51288A
MRQYLFLFLCVSVMYSPCQSLARKKRKYGLGEPWLKTFIQLPEDQWFNQKLDHFDPMSNVTWKQRYGTNDTFFRKGTDSPVFLMIGGEGEASPKWLIQGTWINYAAKYGALCFQLEHRYYGKSHPTPDVSTENLKYLSSEQALADLAYFIQGMKAEYGLTNANKWIAFGGSYPGSLAAWLRFKYPHLVHAAVSSSGPLLAKADFSEYFNVVKAALATYGDNCVQTVIDANHQIELLLKHPVGQQTVNKLFKLCEKIDVHNKKDVQSLFETLADNIAGVVQYNKDNRGLNPYKVTIDTICDILTNHSIGTPVHRYAALNDFMMEEELESCLVYTYKDLLIMLQNTDWTSFDSARLWIYQTCTEFGFYQTSEKKASLFGPTVSLKFFEDTCTDVFGSEFNPQQLMGDIFRTNVMYGALGIEVSRVVFVHGSIDPWHALGVIESNNNEAPAIYINGTAHCANMYPPSDHDSPELKDARVKISEFIGKWLKE